MRRVLSLLALALALSAHGVAAQEPADSATRNAARLLGEEGDRLFDAADYQTALDRYQKALALVDVPTLRLREAYCLEKLGRLLEAAEHAGALAQTELAPDAPPESREAVALAAERHAALTPRIPLLLVRYPGERSGVAITLDGQPYPVERLDQQRPVDPGRHRLEARSSAGVFVRELQVEEATVTTVIIELAAPARIAPPAPAIAPRAEPVIVATPRRGEAGPVLWGLGWTALGLGSAGIIVGVVSGALALDKQNELEELCGESLECPPPYYADVDQYDDMRLAMTVGFAVGAPLAASGIGLLVASAWVSDDSHEALWLRLGPGSMGVGGRF
jgi:hypothetical protein